jgi:hypothetical protein
MSYQEKNITVSLVSYLLIVAYYLVHLFQMLREGELVASKLFGLGAIVILATILVNIIASILTNIVLTIVEAIQAKKYENPRFIADERDRLIALKGIRSSYITFSAGVLVAVLAFAFGQPPLVMVGMIIFFAIAARIIGDISQIYLYRRGF